MPASPGDALLQIGPVVLRWYPLLIALGIFAAIHLLGRELERKGYESELASNMAIIVVPSAIVGARIYHVVTTYERYADDWVAALQIWRGGIGMPGAVIGGAIALWLSARYWGIPWPLDFDGIAPGLILAQAIGRWGNYFNQELFGGPTTLPWGLAIDPRFRPGDFAEVTHFHPTFLYESLWNLGLFLLLWYLRPLDRWWPRGTATLIYLVGYGLVRFWLETVRIDPAMLLGPWQLGTDLTLGPWRPNQVTSSVTLLVFGPWLGYHLWRSWRTHGPPSLGAQRLPT